MNGMMALPNLFSLWLLAPVVKRELDAYLPRIPEFERERKARRG